jgi:hypothetical protein
MLFPNFKVLDIILKKIVHGWIVNRNIPNFLVEVSYILFYILFNFFLGGKGYGVPYGIVVTGILDMRPRKHDLHFLVGVELLPHAFVNIPDEKMNIGVILYLFSLFIYIHIYIYILNFIYIYLFIVFLLLGNCNSY